MADDGFGRQWIQENGIPIVNQYDGITIRALHYRLVSLFGFPNDIQHYKRVITAMTDARWKGLVDFSDFDDHEREVIGSTEYEEKDVDDEIERAKDAIKLWMRSYYLERWSNQPKYIEVWVEKKALQGTFERPCRRRDVALFPCKGYPSLTWLDKARDRFMEAKSADKEVLVLYFGDYDPSGEDIPRSIEENLSRMGCDVEIKRIALLHDQVIEWNLPPAPTKRTDSRSGSWDGIGQVELDAIEPNELQKMIGEAIDSEFDRELHDTLKETEKIEREKYQKEVKEWVLNFEDEDEEESEE
jgi:hypothetical protein